ncbi:MAG: hypothetical protein U9P63_03445 [Patescibacteria group bacterium]|nr:hypothetical protein [Patescibacteria group bacterium]
MKISNINLIFELRNTLFVIPGEEGEIAASQTPRNDTLCPLFLIFNLLF